MYKTTFGNTYFFFFFFDCYFLVLGSYLNKKQSDFGYVNVAG